MDDDNHPRLTGGDANGAALLVADKMRSLNITRTARSGLLDGYETSGKRRAGQANGPADRAELETPPPEATATTKTPTASTTARATPTSRVSGKGAIEQNFILSTLKGVANALKSSHRNSLKQSGCSGRRPTSAISAASTPSSSSSSSSSATSTPHSTIGRRRMGAGHALALADVLTDDQDDQADQSICSMGAGSATKHSSLRARRGDHLAASQHYPNHQPFSKARHRHSTPVSGADLEVASNCSSSSSASSNLSSSNALGPADGYGGLNSTSSNNNFNVTISSNHMSLLESMRFDQTSDIESIKKDLIKICRENRLEILAHYVSQIG